MKYKLCVCLCVHEREGGEREVLCMYLFAFIVSALEGTLTTSPELQALCDPHLSCGGPSKLGPLYSFLPVSCGLLISSVCGA